jgi:hypothetical protein
VSLRRGGRIHRAPLQLVCSGGTTAAGMHEEVFVKRIVLAYSGGLETSVAIPWLG